MKKILYVLPNLGAGGAERAAILVANELIRQYGYTVSFFLFSDDLYNQQYLLHDVKIIHANCYKSNSRIQRIISTYIRSGLSLNAHLNTNNYDIVISGYEVDGELPILEVILKNILCLKEAKIIYISIIQNSLRGICQKNDKRRYPIVLSIISFLRWRLFNEIIAVASTIKAECPQQIRDTITVISNPVNRALLNSRSKEPCAFTESGSIKGPYFVNVARISHQKNQICLVKAFNAIKSKTAWNLMLIGQVTDYGYFVRIQKFIHENGLDERIIFVGTPENPYAYVSKAQAFVFASRYEGNPIAIIEAMVLKKLIISTKFSGYESLLSENNAVLVENENDEQLSIAMLNVSNGAVRKDLLVENAYSSTDSFDASLIAQQYHARFSVL
jgi:GalNAc-alpha-(1->4)-GalNAc-alpha-(1->3)-diNAcBac-PP-undecaprenol alpha-1,4-N-acetyl-D-galactosaminyltransferase